MSEQFDPTATLGVTGLNRSGSQLYSEWHHRLSGRKADAVYREMRDNDPVIGAILYVIQSLLLQADWSVKAADETPEAQAEAAFLEECLNDMSHTWEDLLTEALSMLPFGWAYHELVYKRRMGDQRETGQPSSRYDDGRIGWRSIPVRAQETRDGWMFSDEGSISGMWQIAPPENDRVFIPIEKALLFRTATVQNNPEGRSMLRNAYRPWYFLKRIQEIEAIGVERDLAGLPTMQVPVEMMHKSAPAALKSLRATMENLVSRIRRDEYEGIVIPAEKDADGNPTGFKLSLLSTGGSRQLDVNQIIVRYEQRIAMTMLGQFLLLGMDGVGSFSLVSSSTNLFSVALGGTMDRFASVFNRYAVSRLMRLNGVPEALWPKLVHGDIEAPPIAELAAMVNQLVGVGVMTPDEGLEAKFREWGGLPPRGTTTEAL